MSRQRTNYDTLSKIYNDENTAGLDIKIKEYSDSLDSE